MSPQALNSAQVDPARPNKPDFLNTMTRKGVNYSTDGDMALRHIAEVNSAYLLLAQKLLIADFSQAIEKLHLDAKTGHLLISLSSLQLQKLSQSSSVLCRFNLTDYSLLNGLSGEDYINQLAKKLQENKALPVLSSHR